MAAESVGVRPVPAEVDSCVLEVRGELPAALESAGEARRIVRRALRAANRSELVDAAELAVSEVVSDATLPVIPPSLREAHVAGFSRHLSTGEAHVLGVPLDPPVLCKDGSQVQCLFLIERAPLSRGRAPHVAPIDPLEATAPPSGKVGEA